MCEYLLFFHTQEHKLIFYLLVFLSLNTYVFLLETKSECEVIHEMFHILNCIFEIK